MSLRKKALSLGLAGLLSGCVSSSPVYDTNGNYLGERTDFDPGKTLQFMGYGLAGLAGLGIAQNTQNAMRAYQFGRGVGMLGEHVSQNSQQPVILQYPNSRPQTLFFACNDWIDFNRNGCVDFPSEIVNIKSRFTTKEKIVFTTRILRKKGKDTKFELRNEKGIVVLTNTVKLPTNDSFRWFYFSEGKLEPGTYKGSWYISEKKGEAFAGSTQIEVVGN